MGFLLRAVARFDGQGISCRLLSDNGSAYRALAGNFSVGLTPKRTRPYTPEPRVKSSAMASGRLRLHQNFGEVGLFDGFRAPGRIAGCIATWRLMTQVQMALAGRNPFSNSLCWGY